MDNHRRELLLKQCRVGNLTACMTLQGIQHAKQTAESLEDCGCEGQPSTSGSPGSQEEKPRRQARLENRDPWREEPRPWR
jgi:hypothetical protein